ncbi:MAG: hypothetical protein COA40_14605 [Aequorivita sp.]|nr:MAG: hypothetical protein COA40_14605 [Aequorivita sp.]
MHFDKLRAGFLIGPPSKSLPRQARDRLFKGRLSEAVQGNLLKINVYEKNSENFYICGGEHPPQPALPKLVRDKLFKGGRIS